MMERREFDEHYAASQIARRDSGLRARIKRFYIERILHYARGVTVDIGCGAGQLLEQLPAGSIGLEINPPLVAHLRKKGLNVMQVEPGDRSISLGSLRPAIAQSAVLSHVLEHFDDAATVLRELMRSCTAVGISRLIVVVPGWIGYGSDATHKTFVTLDYLRSRGLLEGADFRVIHRSFFPGNAEWLGRLFVYHELMVVYDLGVVPRDPPPATNAMARKAHLIQFARFLVVGVINTAFSYAIYAALVYFGLNYALANLSALVIGMVFSFKMQGALVFSNSENRRIFRFVLVWAVIYVCNIFVISRFIALGFDPYASGALAIPFATVMSYLAQKFFVFRQKSA